MKIKVKKPFRYQVDARKEAEIAPGIYEVPGEISGELARKILHFGKAEVVVEKKAPENKVVEIAESKAKVAKKPVRRRRPRPVADD